MHKDSTHYYIVMSPHANCCSHALLLCAEEFLAALGVGLDGLGTWLPTSWTHCEQRGRVENI